jgi:hypothetical protein
LDTAGQLLELAGQLSELLVPVQVDANARLRLKGDLLLEAQRRQASRRNVLVEHRKGILIGAAALGSVASVIGVLIAFVLRYRSGHTSHIMI